MDMFGRTPKRTPVEIRRLKLPEVVASEDLTAPDRVKEPDAGCGLTDLLIQGLVERLPKPDALWSVDERAKWLRTAATVFDLVYKDPERERRTIGIAVGNRGSTLTSAPRDSDSEADLSA